MLLRRALIHKETTGLHKKALFYAPLVEDLLPTIAWNDDKTIYRNSGFIINNGTCYSGDSSFNNILYNCGIPSGMTALTFSCWINPTKNPITIGRTFGAITKNNIKGSGCFFDYSARGDRMEGEWVDIVKSSVPYIYQNIWQFITFTLEKTELGWRRKIYKDGVLEYEADGPIRNAYDYALYLGLTDCFFAIGSNAGGNTAPGVYYKHFSCYEALTDEEVMALYNNGGIPIPN